MKHHILRCADGYVAADHRNECEPGATVYPLTAAGYAACKAEVAKLNAAN